MYMRHELLLVHDRQKYMIQYMDSRVPSDVQLYEQLKREICEQIKTASISRNSVIASRYKHAYRHKHGRDKEPYQV